VLQHNDKTKMRCYKLEINYYFNILKKLLSKIQQIPEKTRLLLLILTMSVLVFSITGIFISTKIRKDESVEISKTPSSYPVNLQPLSSPIALSISNQSSISTSSISLQATSSISSKSATFTPVPNPQPKQVQQPSQPVQPTQPAPPVQPTQPVQTIPTPPSLKSYSSKHFDFSFNYLAILGNVVSNYQYSQETLTFTGNQSVFVLVAVGGIGSGGDSKITMIQSYSIKALTGQTFNISIFKDSQGYYNYVATNTTQSQKFNQIINSKLGGSSDDVKLIGDTIVKNLKFNVN